MTVKKTVQALLDFSYIPEGSVMSAGTRSESGRSIA
ncbi:Uncharacterised protein [Nocardia africana]|uniref:Uncharacterized protein n=1 Tax=Nocardia africana TaxID=134964 RepID=A0A378X5D8_9NOCA|nr:Uncharacterised protein [Nocardia africana]